MKNRLLFLLVVISTLTQCSTNKISNLDTQEKTLNAELLNREILQGGKAVVLEVLEKNGFEGASIWVKLCVNKAGQIVYAELLPESTLAIPKDKAKQVLKAIYSITFNESTIEDDCGKVEIR